MRRFGYLVPIKDKDNNIVSHKEKVVSLVTKGVLDGTFGKDKDKPLVVSLKSGDLIEFRPLHTQQRYHISVFDVFRMAIRRKAQAEFLEKARNKKEKKALLRNRRKIQRQERKLVEKV